MKDELPTLLNNIPLKTALHKNNHHDGDSLHFILLIFFYYFVCEAIGTAATPGLLFEPRVIVKMIVEKQIGRGNRSSRRKPSPAPLLSIT
jgi:hypothetical protein